MGWSYGFDSIDQIKRHVTRERVDHDGRGYKTITSVVRGTRLWTVMANCVFDDNKRVIEKRFICLFLLGYHRRTKDYGYKDVTEACGPCEYDCPYSFLAMAPEENAEWRAKVLEWHQKQNLKPKVGELWELVPGLKALQLRIISTKKGIVGKKADGSDFSIYRCAKKFLARKIEDAPAQVEHAEAC